MVERERPLARNLRVFRQRAGLSVVELARRAELGRATLTQLEAGSGNPTLDTLYALAGELGVTLADLIVEHSYTPGTRVVRFGEGQRTRPVAPWSRRRCCTASAPPPIRSRSTP